MSSLRHRRRATEREGEGGREGETERGEGCLCLAKLVFSCVAVANPLSSISLFG